jgi:release factor glutamine methyltransferase
MSVNIQRIKDIRQYLYYELGEIYPEPEIHAIANIITKTLFRQTKLQILAFPENPVTGKTKKEIIRICHELKKGRPLQYIIGETEFYNCKIRLNSATLIPRPETEELVDLIIRDNKGVLIRILDIGTGSGCIAIALAVNLPGAEVSGFDISGEAVIKARENAVLNKANVTFFVADMLIPLIKQELAYDLIVANPPYVKESEKRKMAANVLDFEPHSALFVPDDDPLIFYRAVIKLANTIMKPGGKIYFEINEALGNSVFKLIESSGYSGVEIIKDINGKDRFAKCIKND